MLSTYDLKCFLVLAESLNFTKAASQLFISQQAVSQRIAKIEQELGFPLFTRSRSNVKLTRAGERCYTFFRAANDDGQKLLETCRKEYQEMGKSLNIGYLNMLNWGPIVNRADSAFRKEVPDIRIVGELFDSVILTKHLLAGNIDMMVTYDRFSSKNEHLVKKPVFSTELYLMVSNKHPKATENATYLDFAREPFIEDVFGDEELGQTVDRARKSASRCGLSPIDFVVTPNRDSAYISAEFGRGVIVGTKISNAFHSEWLKKYPTGAIDTLVCIWKEDNENYMIPKYVKCLTKALKEEYKSADEEM